MKVLAAVGLVLTFLVQRWFIDVFDVGENLSCQYSFFGTIASAFLLSFVLRMFVSLYSDLSAQPGLPLSSMFLLIFFIWVTWCVSMACLMWEKISRDIISTALPLNTTQIQKRRRWNFAAKLFFLNTDIYNFVFREDTNLQAKVTWWMGIVLGVLGSLLFAVPMLGLGFLLVSIFFVGIGAFRFWSDKIDFSEFSHACIKI